MKVFKYLAVLAVVASTQIVMGDTLTLVGGYTGNYNIGWVGEGYVNGHWCGDTLLRDTTPDTTISEPDTIRDYFVSNPINDTVIITKTTSVTDTLTVTTTRISDQKILRDSINDPMVDIVSINTTIIDSDIVISCGPNTFLADTGGPVEGETYFNFYYKFRNWWAAIPFVFKGWQGLDSNTINGYTDLLITYKGLLPTHKVSLGFFYGAWGVTDSMANKEGRGDGVGTLEASNEWKTVVIHIPDSVQLYAIAGINLGIGNIDGVEEGQTSEIGNLKVSQIAFISIDSTSSARDIAHRHAIHQDRSFFTPKTKGDIKISVYSLNGAVLCAKTMSVDPSKRYSVRQISEIHPGMNQGQVRIVKIQGAGVDMNVKVW
jgi:hypothetical protein